MKEGCSTIIGIIILLYVGSCVLDYGCRGVDGVKKWRDERLDAKAAEATARKANEAEASRLEAERRKAEEAEEAKRLREEAKEEKIRMFALKESPKVWSVYQSLKGEIEVQQKNIDNLAQTMKMFGRPLEQDEDFVRITAYRDEMIRTSEALRARLEEAYITSKKYEASPSRKDYQDMMHTALEDGMQDAIMAIERYKAMTRQK